MGAYNKQQGPSDKGEFKRIVESNTYGEPSSKQFSTLINHPEIGLQYECSDRWASSEPVTVTDIAPIATSSWASKYASMEKLQGHSAQRKRDENNY